MIDDNQTNHDNVQKSKTQVKKEMLALQQLGERLVLLNNEQLVTLKLPLLLHQAVLEAKKILHHGAKRRQMQYIGKLMRRVEDPASIQLFIDSLDMKNEQAIAFHHMLEGWRDKLMSDDASFITEFVTQFPYVDRQHLRNLVQNAKKERLAGKPLGASRALFRYLKNLRNS